MSSERVTNGETKRKAQLWEWIARVRDVMVVPLIVVLLVQWADVRHIVSEWPDHQVEHIEARDFRSRAEVQFDYINQQLSDLKTQVYEVKTLIKEKR